MSRLVLSFFAVTLPAFTFAADEPSDKSALKCPISGGAVSQDASADYQGGKVYFCCNGCAGKFAKAPDKYATKANYQLVASGQFVQKGCPFSGGAVNPSTLLTLDGVSVGFCCNGCKGKVTKADAAQQQELVFGEKAFPKAFQAK